MIYANKNKYGNYKCACCGFYTIKEITSTCPVCFWEQNFYQEERIDDIGGPNRVSLKISQENYIKYKVMDKQFKEFVREPLSNELGD